MRGTSSKSEFLNGGGADDNVGTLDDLFSPLHFLNGLSAVHNIHNNPSQSKIFMAKQKK